MRERPLADRVLAARCGPDLASAGARARPDHLHGLHEVHGAHGGGLRGVRTPLVCLIENAPSPRTLAITRVGVYAPRPGRGRPDPLLRMGCTVCTVKPVWGEARTMRGT